MRPPSVIASSGLLLALLSASSPVLSQSFEAIDAEFDISDAVVIPPSPTVVTAQPNSAELGPAVTNTSADTNPLPVVNQTAAAVPAIGSAAEPGLGSMAPVSDGNLFDVSQAVQPGAVSSAGGGNQELLQRQLDMQEQQLRRIERVEQGLNKLVKKQSFSKSIMGTILSAATTADPVLSALGGIAGFLIGKAEDYKQAEKKNYDLQQDILRKSPGSYSNEELKLAAYADLDLDPALLSASQIKTYANYVVEAKTRKKFGGAFGTDLPGENGHLGFMVANRQGNFSGQYTTAGRGSAPATMPNVNYADVCYNHLRSASGGSVSSGMTPANMTTRSGNTQSLAADHRRNLARYCFYSLR